MSLLIADRAVVVVFAAGMRVSTADPVPLDLLSLIATVAVGVGILHHAYTREWERR